MMHSRTPKLSGHWLHNATSVGGASTLDRLPLLGKLRGSMQRRRASTSVASSRTASDVNRSAYESSDIVAVYARREDLQKPEQQILNLLADRLPRMRMLDLAVGAGRTAYHFLPRAADYIGLDYSSRMIDACRCRFPARANCFRIGDMRSLGPFRGDGFDFVLCSFNGIDCMDHDDRLQVLREVRRVSRTGAYFGFSSHNLRGVDTRLWSPPPSWAPRQVLEHVGERIQFHRANDRARLRELEKLEYAMVHGPRTSVYCITVAAQLTQ